MSQMRLAVLIALLLAATPAGAHEVQHVLSRGETWIVTLQTDDGQPFAGQPWELRDPASGQPIIEGRTDARGRLAFPPPAPGHYQLRAESPDGHGVVLPLDLGASETPSGAPATGDQLPGRRWAVGVSALGYLLGVFGVASLLLRRRRAE